MSGAEERLMPASSPAEDELVEIIAAQMWLDTFGPDSRRDWHTCVREAEEYGPESAAAMQVYQWRARAKRFADAIRPWLDHAVAEHPSDIRAAKIIREAAARIEELLLVAPQGATDAERAYGVLWRIYGCNVGYAHDARQILRDSLTREARRRGIAWANAKYGPLGPDPALMLNEEERAELGRSVPEIRPED